jgi:hypothetical protein
MSRMEIKEEIIYFAIFNHKKYVDIRMLVMYGTIINN